ncbi:hypothetical protein HYH03_017449 [Edaphochlamys debaryana]|uniref:Arp2/3 complex 34 kDa subunit n=1 Tax=Edaphochlamys debaryana TaxID=47281 RepID=A0A836BNX5_9CHLO|nr:hypothetical protein HYH03_017449 [Edaphochlamys debaryana]|eukprot:KAG2483731.1 hypothetical protein HYH03_017449 [Edaphochlamys debaryana]
MSGSGILISCQNRVIQARIHQLLQQKAAGQDIQPFEESAHEFGGCEYRLVVGAPAGAAPSAAPGGAPLSVRLYFSMPSLPPPFQKQARVVGADVMAHVAAAFQGVAALVPPPPGPPAPPPPAPAPAPVTTAAAAGAAGAKGPPRASCAPCPAPTPVVALEVDVPLLSRLSEGQREGWSRALASLRVLLAGHPIRQVFQALEAGTLQGGPPLLCCNTPGQAYVIKPAGPDAVALVFPLVFSSRQDAAIGVACLQEFVEARRGAALGRAPIVSYSARDVPGEMTGVDLSPVLGPGGGSLVNGGYLTFSLSRRHVAGPQQEGLVWLLACLHHFVHYHVKATKSMMHSRMRRRVAAMVDLLGGAAAGAAGGVAAAAAAAAAGGGAGLAAAP